MPFLIVSWLQLDRCHYKLPKPISEEPVNQASFQTISSHFFGATPAVCIADDSWRFHAMMDKKYSLYFLCCFLKMFLLHFCIVYFFYIFLFFNIYMFKYIEGDLNIYHKAILDFIVHPLYLQGRSLNINKWRMNKNIWNCDVWWIGFSFNKSGRIMWWILGT